MTKKHHKEINRLEKALQKWRATHSRPTPIPSSIWSGAAQLAGDLGVGSVAKKLRLDYTKLKKLTEKLAPGPCSESLATFLEFRPTETTPQIGLVVSCAIEVTGTNGGVLRARLDGLPAADLGTVFRVFGS